MIEFEAETAAKLYEEGLYKFRVCARREDTRNGEVLAMPGPALFTLRDPQRRVIDDPIRRANPFFHLMEFVWMMAGENKVEWLLPFNKRMEEYADDGIQMAAYGYRWRVRFGFDQIKEVVSILRRDPNTRQAVLQMWEPAADLGLSYHDKACNTSIMFRRINGGLDALVTNRSNDFVWGALGANIVHLTFLHELIALGSGIPLGNYRVISNNLHMYTGMPRFGELYKQLSVNDIYRHGDREPLYLLQRGERLEVFLDECKQFVRGNHELTNNWLLSVAEPALLAHQAYKVGDWDTAFKLVDEIVARDWELTCRNWLQRKKEMSLSATSTALSP